MDSETTQSQLLAFIWRECFAEERDIFEKYQLDIYSRVQKGICVTDLKFDYETVGGAFAYAFDSLPNLCLNEGDLLVLNKGKPRGDTISRGLTVWLKEIDFKKKQIVLESSDLSFDRAYALDVGCTYTLDRGFSKLNYCHLDQAVRAAFDKPCELQNIIAGRHWPDPGITNLSQNSSETLSLKAFTKQQNLAYHRSATSDLTLIQGPPGSGKTKLLSQIILRALNEKKSVLVTAYTHSAINNLLSALVKLIPDEDTLFKITGAKSNHKLEGVTRLECTERSLAAIMEQPVVIGASVFKAHAINQLNLRKFDLIIIDEAAQMPIPHALAPMMCGSKYVLAGDHQQLPPVLKTPNSGLLENSIFEYLHDFYPELNVALDVTFRMNEEITEFPSRQFYSNRLKSFEGNANRKFSMSATKDIKTAVQIRLEEILLPEGPPSRQIVADEASDAVRHILTRTESVTFVEVPHLNCTSTSAKEAEAAARIAYSLIVDYGLPPSELAIISPFKKHKNDIAQRLRKLLFKKNDGAFSIVKQIAIDTVEKMQGQEREVVIVSFCASTPSYLKNCQNFLYKPNRLNVAITRSKSRLFIIASPSFFPSVSGIKINPHHARIFNDYYKYLSSKKVSYGTTQQALSA